MFGHLVAYPLAHRRPASAPSSLGPLSPPPILGQGCMRSIPREGPGFCGSLSHRDQSQEGLVGLPAGCPGLPLPVLGLSLLVPPPTRVTEFRSQLPAPASGPQPPTDGSLAPTLTRVEPCHKSLETVFWCRITLPCVHIGFHVV